MYSLVANCISQPPLKNPGSVPEEIVYTENPQSGKSPVNQESQELLSTVGVTWSSKLIKISTCNGHVRQYKACFPL